MSDSCSPGHKHRRVLPRVGRVFAMGAAGALVAVAAGAPVRSASADTARQLPARFTRSPYSLMSLSVGSPNDGWQLRSRELRSRPSLAIKSNSASNAFAHPSLVFMLQRSADEVAREFPGSVLLVGDLSAEHGGPLAGHRSHQSGRDADVAFYVRDGRGRSFQPERFVAFGTNGQSITHRGLVFDEARNFKLVASWLRDGRARVTNIFVARELRQRLLAHGARIADRVPVDRMATVLSQPAGECTHNDHFHVRIACPDRQDAVCEEAPR
ncbi:MAG: penicillin-insensitive murein endopeptidase [Polyangiaceae bacterium]|nr:penicillin-insensitive murein endopeptidase [Polyangiaceae bacterium]